MMDPNRGRHLSQQPVRRWSPLPIVAMTLALLVIAFGAYLVINRPAGGSSCSSGSLALQVVAAPDEASIINDAANTYGQSHPEAGGRCVTVQVHPLESAQAAAALAKGWQGVDGPRPDVWVPASSAWAQQLQLGLAASGQPDLIPDQRPKVATSPLVFAMPRPMAQTLGWPRRPLGWTDLLGLLQRSGGWGSLGKPDWGPFKLGKTDPTISTPALESLIGAVFAATGKGSDISVADLKAKSAVLRTLVLGIDRAPGPDADVPATLLDNLRRADRAGTALGFLSAVPVDEKSVLDYNKGNPSGDPEIGDSTPPKVPLVAIYPKEGTLEADHPWLVLEGSWVDEDKQRAAADFYRYLTGDEVQAKFLNAGFRGASGATGPETDETNGLSAGQPARVLAPPTDPRVVAGVLESWKAARKRSNVLAVFDVSGSMKEPVPGTGATKMDLVKKAALTALRLFAPETNVGTWEFSTKLDGDKDYRESVPIGPMSAKLPSGRTRLEVSAARDAAMQATNGDTGLYDTTLAAVRYVQQHWVPDRLNLVVLLTDGINDDPGSISLGALTAKLKAERGDRPVQVITIAYGANADTNALGQIAKATGGLPFESRDPRDIVRVFTSVITNLPTGGAGG